MGKLIEIKVKDLVEGDRVSITGLERHNCTVVGTEELESCYRVELYRDWISKREKADGYTRDNVMHVPKSKVFRFYEK